MEYLLLIYQDEARAQAAMPEERLEKMNRNWAIHDDAARKGVLRAAAPLEYSSVEGSRVRSANGKVESVDGPFTETKEVLGGYWIFDCAGLDEAREWAARLAQTGCAQTVEVRRLRPMPGRADCSDAKKDEIAFVNA